MNHAKKTAKAVIQNLRNRKGLDHAWDAIDPEIQKEIAETVEEIIANGIAAGVLAGVRAAKR